jgi:microcin C transport system ATP-binding protein
MNRHSLLEVSRLTVSFEHAGRITHAVEEVGFSIERGETLALVGESGSGKSMTAHSILRLLPGNARLCEHSSIRVEGEELVTAGPDRLRAIRGGRIGMVFQEPMTSLNPLHTIERQIGEMLLVHRGLRSNAARTRTIELLHEVGLGDAERRLGAYPHQLSGGQRQRVMIAMALANEPALLIADEPTTALDVTVQAQILQTLKRLQRSHGMALLLISHDLGIVRRLADRVAVMTAGRIVETAPVVDIFTRPRHVYTRQLLAAEPDARVSRRAEVGRPLLVAEDVRVIFPIRSGIFRRRTGEVRAVDGVSLMIRERQTLGVVGESGSGKSTLGLALLQLQVARGRICWNGVDLASMKPRALRTLRREFQIVFQDPFSSLSPRLAVGQIIDEGLRVHQLAGTAAERERRIAQALEEVGLDPAARHRYPHEFSGGQRQRIAIARALVLKPRLVVLDEPTSALDRSVQVQLLALLRDLQARHSLAYMFISHDLKVIRALADEVVVMQHGRFIETGPAEQLFASPQHPYTQALFAAAFDLAVPADRSGTTLDQP